MWFLAKGLGYQDAIIFWDMEKETIVDFYNYYYEYSAADQGLDFRGLSDSSFRSGMEIILP